MPKHTFWNIGKANAEISAADSAINPLLEAAKITSIKVNGTELPASDAPLSDKIAALAAVSKPGVATQDMSELVQSNDLISKQLEKANTDLAIANTSVASLQRENATLTTHLQTAQAGVNKLTADNAELQNRHDSAIHQVGDLTKQANAVNQSVSLVCLEYGCLDLTGEDGKPLAKDASDAQRLAAALRVPVADKLTASKGAVNAAVRSLGVPIAGLPAPGLPSRAGEKAEVKGRERMKAAMRIDGVTAS